MMSGQSFDNFHDGPRRVYVHHINENHVSPVGYPYAQPPPPQPMYIPMPFPIPQPQPMPTFMGGMGMGMGGYGGFHQQPQPPVIIINGGEQKPDQKLDQKKEGGKSPPPPSTKAKEDPPPANPFHPVSLVSVIFFVIATILGFICVAKIYDVFESSMNNNNDNEDGGLDEHMMDYLVVHRTVALGMGAASILMFSIAFLLSFYAGMRYRLKGDNSKKKNCCLGGLLIAAWILFCLTFINGLIILVLAFDEEARIYPEVALTAVIGNMVSWICMFGYSQLARMSGR